MIRTPHVAVQRWSRYGQDRAYVRIDDLQVGYRDLHSGDVVCDHREHAEVIARATARLFKEVSDYAPRHARSRRVLAWYARHAPQSPE